MQKSQRFPMDTWDWKNLSHLELKPWDIMSLTQESEIWEEREQKQIRTIWDAFSNSILLLLLCFSVSLIFTPLYLILISAPREKNSNILKMYLNWHFGYLTLCLLYMSSWRSNCLKPRYLYVAKCLLSL